MVDSKIVLADFMVDAVDRQVRQNQAVGIAEGRITAVGHRDAIVQNSPLDSERIELGGVYLTPGLIDGHTHAKLGRRRP